MTTTPTSYVPFTGLTTYSGATPASALIPAVIGGQNYVVLASDLLTLANPLPISQGGTGKTTAITALQALGGAPATVLAIAGAGLNGGGQIGKDFTFTVADTTVVPATYGSATAVAQVTFNSRGQATFAQNVTIAGVAPGGAAGGDLSGTYPNPTVIATHLSVPLPVTQGGTGNGSYTDGQLLIGNTATGLLSKATLTAGSNISITNGNGSIAIAVTAGAGVSSIADNGGGTLTFSAATGAVLAGVATNGIGNAQIRQSAGLSVIGRSATTTGNVADITGTADQVLRVAAAGASLGFGAIALASAAAVSGILGAANGGTGHDFSASSGYIKVTAGTFSAVGTANLMSSIAFGTTGLTPSAATGGAVTVAGTLAVANGGTGVTASTGTVAVVLSNSPTLVTPTLGVASATSLATSAASPLLLTNGQLVTVALTSQTVGAATLTIPNFANVSDTFAMVTLAQTLANKTLTTPIINTAAHVGGTWVADATWTLPAHTLGGTVSGGGNQINNVIIGTSTPLAGAFTTLSSTGAYTNTVADGTTPMVITSTTTVANLKAAAAAGSPINSQSAAYQFVLGDAGKTVYHPTTDNNARTFTVPANGTVAFPVGTLITVINDINTITITTTTDTMVLAGTGSTGDRTLAVNGVCTMEKVTSIRWYINGTGLT